MVWQCRDFSLPLDRVRVMGVVNVTPDSFSDGGRFSGAAAVAHGMRLVGEGADLVDVGGESSRPGAAEVPVEEELARVLPVVGGLVREGAKVSVDTRRAAVARAALDAGAHAVNDISAGLDAGMFRAARDAGAGMALMRGGSDVWWERKPIGKLKGLPFAHARMARAFLRRRVACALQAGIAAAALVVDPGVGFTDGAGEDVLLLRMVGSLAKIAPVMVGVSRKRFIGRLSGAAEPAGRLAGSLAAALFAVSRGARIVRVHDVAETVRALRVWEGLDA